MALTNCPLYESPFYSYTIDLADETYTLTFRWSSRSEQYLLSIADSEDNSILRGIALVPYFPLLKQYALSNLTGEFILIPYEQSDLPDASIPDPRNLYKSHFLVFDDTL